MRAGGGPLAAGASCALLALAAAGCGGSGTASAPAAGAAAQSAQAGGFSGASLPAGPPHDFTLADPLGRRVSTLEYRGQVVVLAFLGTRCGAPCTVIAEQIRGALDQLARPVPVLLVSIDPVGDTHAAIVRFLARVSLTGRARYLSVRGAGRALVAVWRAYHVPGPAQGAGVFERFAPVFLLDRSGRARVEYGLEQLTPEALAHDVAVLAGRGPSGGG